jgi:fibronectin-binding autotransporter adhesin
MSNHPNLSLGSTGDYTLNRDVTPANNTYRFGGGGGTLTVAIALRGSRSLVTAGNVTLSGSNSYTNSTTVNAGNLQFATPAAIPTAGTTMINAGGAVLVNGAYTTASEWLDSSKGRIDSTSTGALALTANSSESINMNGYSGLSIGANGSYTYSGSITPANNTYRFGGGGGVLTVSSVLSNNGIAKSLVTTGNVILTGSNNYTGATRISGGKTTLSGYGSIASSSGVTVSAGAAMLQNSAVALSRPLTLESGSTFGGTGTYSGNLSIGDGAHLSPGSGGVGTLTVSGNLSLSLGSVLDYDLGGGDGFSDVIALNGHSLILAGTLNVLDTGAISSGSYTIFSGASSIIDHGLTFGDVPSTHDWFYRIVKNGGTFNVVVTAAPEPGTSVLLSAALLSLAGRALPKARKLIRLRSN